MSRVTIAAKGWVQCPKCEKEHQYTCYGNPFDREGPEIDFTIVPCACLPEEDMAERAIQDARNIVSENEREQDERRRWG